MADQDQEQTNVGSFQSDLTLSFQLAGVDNAKQAAQSFLNDLLSTGATVDSITDKLGGNQKAVEALTRMYKRYGEQGTRANKRVGESLRYLHSDFMGLRTTIRGVTQSLKDMVFPSSLTSAVKESISYNTTLLKLSASTNRLGIGINTLDTNLRRIGRTTLFTRKETMKLFDSFQEGMKTVDLGGFENMLQRIKSLVGANAEAAESYQQAIIGVSQKYPELGKQLANIETADKKALDARIRSLYLIGKIGEAEYRRLGSYISGNKQMSSADRAHQREIQQQIDMQQRWQKQVEEIKIVFGNTLLPVLEQVNKILKGIQGSGEKGSRTIRNLGVAVASLYVGKKMLGGIAGIGKTIKGIGGSLGLGGGKRGGLGASLIGAASATPVRVVNFPSALTSPSGSARALAGRMGSPTAGERGSRLIKAQMLGRKKAVGDFLFRGAFSTKAARAGRLAQAGKFASSPVGIAAQFAGSYVLGKLEKSLEAKGKKTAAAFAGTGKSALGITAGVSTGAMIGSIIPGIGTAIGGVIGGLTAVVADWGNISKNVSRLYQDLAPKWMKETFSGISDFYKDIKKSLGFEDKAEVQAKNLAKFEDALKKATDKASAERSIQMQIDAAIQADSAQGANLDFTKIGKEYSTASDKLEQVQRESNQRILDTLKGSGLSGRVMEAMKKESDPSKAMAVLLEEQEKLIADMQNAKEDLEKTEGNEEALKLVQEQIDAQTKLKETIEDKKDAETDSNENLKRASIEFKIQEGRMENATRLAERYKDVVSALAGYSQSQTQYMANLFEKMSILGKVDLSSIRETMDDTLNSIEAEIRARRENLDIIQQRKALLKSTGKESVSVKELILTEGLSAGMKRNLESLVKQGVEHLDIIEVEKEEKQLIAEITAETKRRTEAQLAVKAAMQEQLKATTLQAQKADLLIQLADNYAIGVGASAEIRYKAYQAEGRHIEVLKDTLRLQTEQYMKAKKGGVENLALRNAMRETEMEILNSQIKQAQQVKGLRDAWVSAISAMNTGGDTLSEIVMDAEQNTAQIMKMGGAVRSATSGAVALRDAFGRITENVGYQVAEVMDQFGEISSASGRTGFELSYTTPTTEKLGVDYRGPELQQKFLIEGDFSEMGRDLEKQASQAAESGMSALAASGNEHILSSVAGAGFVFGQDIKKASKEAAKDLEGFGDFSADVKVKMGYEGDQPARDIVKQFSNKYGDTIPVYVVNFKDVSGGVPVEVKKEERRFQRYENDQGGIDKADTTKGISAASVIDLERNEKILADEINKASSASQKVVISLNGLAKVSKIRTSPDQVTRDELDFAIKSQIILDTDDAQEKLEKFSQFFAIHGQPKVDVRKILSKLDSIPTEVPVLIDALLSLPDLTKLEKEFLKKGEAVLDSNDAQEQIELLSKDFSVVAGVKLSDTDYLKAIKKLPTEIAVHGETILIDKEFKEQINKLDELRFTVAGQAILNEDDPFEKLKRISQFFTVEGEANIDVTKVINEMRELVGKKREISFVGYLDDKNVKIDESTRKFLEKVDLILSTEDAEKQIETLREDLVLRSDLKLDTSDYKMALRSIPLQFFINGKAVLVDEEFNREFDGLVNQPEFIVAGTAILNEKNFINKLEKLNRFFNVEGTADVDLTDIIKKLRKFEGEGVNIEATVTRDKIGGLELKENERNFLIEAKAILDDRDPRRQIKSLVKKYEIKADLKLDESDYKSAWNEVPKGFYVNGKFVPDSEDFIKKYNKLNSMKFVVAGTAILNEKRAIDKIKKMSKIFTVEGQAFIDMDDVIKEIEEKSKESNASVVIKTMLDDREFKEGQRKLLEKTYQLIIGTEEAKEKLKSFGEGLVFRADAQLDIVDYMNTYKTLPKKVSIEGNVVTLTDDFYNKKNILENTEFIIAATSVLNIDDPLEKINKISQFFTVRGGASIDVSKVIEQLKGVEKEQYVSKIKSIIETDFTDADIEKEKFLEDIIILLNTKKAEDQIKVLRDKFDLLATLDFDPTDYLKTYNSIPREVKINGEIITLKEEFYRDFNKLDGLKFIIAGTAVLNEKDVPSQIARMSEFFVSGDADVDLKKVSRSLEDFIKKHQNIDIKTAIDEGYLEQLNAKEKEFVIEAEIMLNDDDANRKLDKLKEIVPLRAEIGLDSKQFINALSLLPKYKNIDVGFSIYGDEAYNQIDELNAMKYSVIGTSILDIEDPVEKIKKMSEVFDIYGKANLDVKDVVDEIKSQQDKKPELVIQGILATKEMSISKRKFLEIAQIMVGTKDAEEKIKAFGEGISLSTDFKINEEEYSKLVYSLKEDIPLNANLKMQVGEFYKELANLQESKSSIVISSILNIKDPVEKLEKLNQLMTVNGDADLDISDVIKKIKDTTDESKTPELVIKGVLESGDIKENKRRLLEAAQIVIGTEKASELINKFREKELDKDLSLRAKAELNVDDFYNVFKSVPRKIIVNGRMDLAKDNIYERVDRLNEMKFLIAGSAILNTDNPAEQLRKMSKFFTVEGSASIDIENVAKKLEQFKRDPEQAKYAIEAYLKDEDVKLSPETRKFLERTKLIIGTDDAKNAVEAFKKDLILRADVSLDDKKYMQEYDALPKKLIIDGKPVLIEEGFFKDFDELGALKFSIAGEASLNADGVINQIEEFSKFFTVKGQSKFDLTDVTTKLKELEQKKQVVTFDSILDKDSVVKDMLSLEERRFVAKIRAVMDQKDPEDKLRILRDNLSLVATLDLDDSEYLEKLNSLPEDSSIRINADLLTGDVYKGFSDIQRLKFSIAGTAVLDSETISDKLKELNRFFVAKGFADIDITKAIEKIEYISKDKDISLRAILADKDLEAQFNAKEKEFLLNAVPVVDSNDLNKAIYFLNKNFVLDPEIKIDEQSIFDFYKKVPTGMDIMVNAFLNERGVLNGIKDMDSLAFSIIGTASLESGKVSEKIKQLNKNFEVEGYSNIDINPIIKKIEQIEEKNPKITIDTILQDPSLTPDQSKFLVEFKPVLQEQDLKKQINILEDKFKMRLSREEQKSAIDKILLSGLTGADSSQTDKILLKMFNFIRSKGGESLLDRFKRATVASRKGSEIYGGESQNIDGASTSKQLSIVDRSLREMIVSLGTEALKVDPFAQYVFVEESAVDLSKSIKNLNSQIESYDDYLVRAAQSTNSLTRSQIFAQRKSKAGREDRERIEKEELAVEVMHSIVKEKPDITDEDMRKEANIRMGGGLDGVSHVADLMRDMREREKIVVQNDLTVLNKNEEIDWSKLADIISYESMERSATKKGEDLKSKRDQINKGKRDAYFSRKESGVANFYDNNKKTIDYLANKLSTVGGPFNMLNPLEGPDRDIFNRNKEGYGVDYSYQAAIEGLAAQWGKNIDLPSTSELIEGVMGSNKVDLMEPSMSERSAFSDAEHYKSKIANAINQLTENISDEKVKKSLHSFVTAFTNSTESIKQVASKRKEWEDMYNEILIRTSSTGKPEDSILSEENMRRLPFEEASRDYYEMIKKSSQSQNGGDGDEKEIGFIKSFISRNSDVMQKDPLKGSKQFNKLIDDQFFIPLMDLNEKMTHVVGKRDASHADEINSLVREFKKNNHQFYDTKGNYKNKEFGKAFEKMIDAAYNLKEGKTLDPQVNTDVWTTATHEKNNLMSLFKTQSQIYDENRRAANAFSRAASDIGESEPYHKGAMSYIASNIEGIVQGGRASEIAAFTGASSKQAELIKGFINSFSNFKMPESEEMRKKEVDKKILDFMEQNKENLPFDVITGGLGELRKVLVATPRGETVSKASLSSVLSGVDAVTGKLDKIAIQDIDTLIEKPRKADELKLRLQRQVSETGDIGEARSLVNSVIQAVTDNRFSFAQVPGEAVGSGLYLQAMEVIESKRKRDIDSLNDEIKNLTVVMSENSEQIQKSQKDGKQVDENLVKKQDEYKERMDKLNASLVELSKTDTRGYAAKLAGVDKDKITDQQIVITAHQKSVDLIEDTSKNYIPSIMKTQGRFDKTIKFSLSKEDVDNLELFRQKTIEGLDERLKTSGHSESIAIGDERLKWENMSIDDLHKKFFGKTIEEGYYSTGTGMKEKAVDDSNKEKIEEQNRALAQSKSEEIQKLEQSVTALDETINKNKEEVDKLSKQYKSSGSENKLLENQINDLNKTIDRDSSLRSKIEARISDIKGKDLEQYGQYRFDQTKEGKIEARDKKIKERDEIIASREEKKSSIERAQKEWDRYRKDEKISGEMYWAQEKKDAQYTGDKSRIAEVEQREREWKSQRQSEAQNFRKIYEETGKTMPQIMQTTGLGMGAIKDLSKTYGQEMPGKMVELVKRIGEGGETVDKREVARDVFSRKAPVEMEGKAEIAATADIAATGGIPTAPPVMAPSGVVDMATPMPGNNINNVIMPAANITVNIQNMDQFADAVVGKLQGACGEVGVIAANRMAG